MGYRIKTSDITGGAAMPVKKGTFDLFNSEFGWLSQQIMNIGDKYTSSAVVVWGLVPTISGSDYSFTQGVVYYSNQLYAVPAASFTLTGGQVPVLVLDTTYLTNAWSDPVTFTDGNSYNVHQFNAMLIQAGASGSGVANWSDVNYWNTPWVTFTGSNFTSAAWRIRRGLLCFRGQVVSTATSVTITLPSWVKISQSAARTLMLIDPGDTSYTYWGIQLRVFASTNDVVIYWAGPKVGTVGTGSEATLKWDLTAANSIPTY